MNPQLNIEEHRLAIINKKKWKVTFFWNKLSIEQQIELFQLSLSERNLEMADFLYHKTPTLLDSTTYVKKELEYAVKNNDKELIQFILERAKVYRLQREYIGCDIENIIFNWANSNEHVNIMSQLDYSKITEVSGQVFFIEKLVKKGYYITIDDTVSDPQYQIVLNLITKNDINLAGHIEKIIQEMIHMDGYITENETNAHELPKIQKVIEDYIKDERFLKKMLRLYPEKYPYETTDKLKQNILNGLLNYAVRTRENTIAQYFVEQGAKINNKDEKLIQWILNEKNLYLIQHVIECGTNIDKYKREAISAQIVYGDREILKYLISQFKDKNEAIIYIMCAEDPALKLEKLPIHEQERVKQIKKEMTEYTECLLFEEKLQATLSTSHYQSKNKL